MAKIPRSTVSRANGPGAGVVEATPALSVVLTGGQQGRRVVPCMTFENAAAG